MHLIKRLLLSISLPCMLHTMATAQTLPFFLDKYTIPLNEPGAAIARGQDHKGRYKDLQLIKDTSGLFTIVKRRPAGSYLSLKKGVGLTPGVFKYEVTLKSGNDTAAFVLVKDEFIHNKVIAHRGAWKNTAGSQNSLTSLKEAIRDPTAKVAYLNGDKTVKELYKDGIWGLDYNFNLYKKDKELLSNARKRGVTTNIWTVNDPNLMEELLEAGVNFITTDEPEMLLEKVKNGE